VRIIRTIVIGLATVLALAAPQLAKAQDFPTRPVRIVVAFPPGGPTDFVGRMIADKMTTLLGQRVYIDNKAGANGTLGGGDVAKSDPDGYSLFLTTAGAVTVSPHIQAKMPFDTFRDFAPVALVTKVSEVLVVSPKLGVKNVKDLVALAKQKPGAVTFASTGVGSPPHLAQILLATAADVKFLHVPYRGAAPALTDMLAGRLDGLFGDVPTIMAQVKAGKLKALAATSSERSDIFPDVPTFVEQGFADVVGDNWDAVLAPAGTPAPIIAKLNAALVAAVNDPEVRTRLHNAGTTPAPSSPEEFDKYLRAEIARWGKVIRDKGITGE